jgi:hypothetical protein
MLLVSQFRKSEVWREMYEPLPVPAGAAWAVVIMTSQIERSRWERHRVRFYEFQKAPSQSPPWYRAVRSWWS